MITNELTIFLSLKCLVCLSYSIIFDRRSALSLLREWLVTNLEGKSLRSSAERPITKTQQLRTAA